MKSLAEQDVAQMGGPASVLSRQKRDHIELDRLLHRLDGAPAGEEGAVLLKIYRLVFPHAYAEETLLWPVMRRVLPDGHELTLRVELEHQEINELVTRLESLPRGSPERTPVLRRLVQMLQEDVRDEEDLLLPSLQAKLSASQLRRLGIAWDVVRRISPTRPHAIVSRRPPGNILSALPLAIVDRCRDGVDALVERAPAAPSPALQALSAALKRTSHAIEHLPGLKAGEDRATRQGSAKGSPYRAPALAALAVSALLVNARRRRRAAMGAA